MALLGQEKVLPIPTATGCGYHFFRFLRAFWAVSQPRQDEYNQLGSSKEQMGQKGNMFSLISSSLSPARAVL